MAGPASRAWPAGGLTIEARPPAKLNLTLEVGPRRADGYHDLRSVFLRIGLADLLTVTASGTEDSLTVAGLPCPTEGNLVTRAFELLRRTVEPGLPGLAATLDKRIPMGGGLGGGSSDGAAALDLAANAWGVGLAPGQRSELALALGSDVPFFAAHVPAALVEGRGERVAPLPVVAGGAGILLALAPAPLSTADVFARFDALAAPQRHGDATTDSLASALAGGLTGEALADRVTGLRDANDLWPAAAEQAPELAQRRLVLELRSGRPWLMSGSGPTLFTLLPSVAAAVAIGSRLTQEPSAFLGGVMLCVTDLVSPEPAWRHQWPTEP